MVVKTTLRKSASPKQALSKSLGRVASNKGMKKSDVKRTITNKQIMLQDAIEDYNTLTKKWLKATPNQDRTKDKASINLKRIDTNKKIRALTKEIKSLNKTAIKVNNKDLSKSLGSVASNKGMNKANLQGTYNEQKRRAYNHYIESQTDYDGNGGVSTYNMTEYLKAKKAQKQMKSIDKTAKKQGVKLKK